MLPSTHRIAVTSTAPPTVRWSCPRCPHDEFESSGRFRMNCNGKLADIWLIYRCARCDATKNVTVVERTPTRRVRPELFAAATDNDPVVARSVARDLSLLKAAGARVARGDQFVVEPVLVPARIGGTVFELHFPEPLLVRLDDVIAAALAVPRSTIRGARSAGAIEVVEPGRVDKLALWGAATVFWRQ